MACSRGNSCTMQLACNLLLGKTTDGMCQVYQQGECMRGHASRPGSPSSCKQGSLPMFVAPPPTPTSYPLMAGGLKAWNASVPPGLSHVRQLVRVC